MADNLSLDRIGKVTGSRIAGVLGMSPYRTRKEVMREMVREAKFEPPEFDGNFITEFGSEHEVDGVMAYEIEHGIEVVRQGDDQVTVVSPDKMFAVTPDGLVVGDGGLGFAGGIEVKCPWRALYTSWTERRDYEQQMRLVAEILGLDWVDFVVWRMSGTSITRMERGVGVDEEGKRFDLDWLPSVMPEVERFLEEYNRIIASDELSAPYIEGEAGYRYDPEWLEAAATVLDLMSEKERIERALVDAQRKAELLTLESSAKGGGLHVVYSRPRAGGKGTVSWKKLAEAELARLGVEIDDDLQDKYRGPAPAGGGRGIYSFRRLSDDTTIKEKK